MLERIGKGGNTFESNVLGDRVELSEYLIVLVSARPKRAESDGNHAHISRV